MGPKSPLLKEYLQNFGAEEDPPSPLYELEHHTTNHLFRCPSIPTDLMPMDLWRRSVLFAKLLKEWQTVLDDEEEA